MVEARSAAVRIERFSAATFQAAEDDLVDLLRACVDGGASLGYLAPMPEAEARDYWRGLAGSVASGNRLVLAARESESGRIIGSGQIIFEARPNGRHRAEVSKLLVLPSCRGQGIGSRLMHELERAARERSIRLLFLDTSEGRSGARRLYEMPGYTYAGGIPEWALDPDGTPAKNAIFFKLLERE